MVACASAFAKATMRRVASDVIRWVCRPYRTWFVVVGVYPGLTSWSDMCRPFGAFEKIMIEIL